MSALLVNAQEISAQALPSGWTSKDINAIGGSAISSNGTWTVAGSGSNIWGTADAFQFTYRSITGDFDYSVRLAAFDATNQWAKAGVMVRESLAANARNAFATFSHGTGPALQYRAATGGSTNRIATSPRTLPSWLRLVRQGTRFTAYTSTDGANWTTVGSTTIGIASSAYVGFGVTSRDVATIGTATFTNVVLLSGASDPTSPPPPPPSSATWTSADVGAPALVGTSSDASGTFTVTGGGIDVWGTADQFHYYYQTVQGDAEIVARVTGFQGGWAGSKAGVMIRQSLSAGSAHGFMISSAGSGYAFQRRVAPSGATSHSDGPGGTPPGWVRLVREGDLFSAYQSADGSNWTLVGADRITMSGSILVGLAVSSVNASTRATAIFTNVSVRAPTAGTNQPPSVTLTAPASGATYNAPATIALAASASDADGTISRVDFYRGSTLIQSDTTSPYSASWGSAPAGTYSLTAIAYDNEGAATRSPAVTVTVNGSTNQAPVVSFVSPAQGASFSAGATIYIEAAASDNEGIGRVDLFQGTTLIKSDFTIPYSHNLTGVAAGTHQLRAVAYDTNGLSTTSTVSVTVNPAGNQLPIVAITAPANGAYVATGSTVTIQASASDPDGTIQGVEFYRGTTLIATDTTSPYTASWANASSGTYSLTARAYDNTWASRTSAAVTISVGSTTNQPPTVAITSPLFGASFIAPASVTIAATAADVDGTIAGVDFYVGTQLIGSDTTSPYTASWTNVAAGTYSLTAVARDNAGASRTSTAVSVNVSGAATRPTTLVFTASVDHNTLVTSYLVALYRQNDPVTASPVATRDIGRPAPSGGDISVDITTLVTLLPTGNYYAVVSAFGAAGSSPSAPSGIFAK